MRRIVAYAQYFSEKKWKTLFLVQPKVAERIGDLPGIDVTAVETGVWAKAAGRAPHLRRLGERPRWLFSYGIPLHAPIGERNWFHVSNALPLYLGHATVSPRLFAKMAFLRLWLKLRAGHCDVVSAESRFSLDRYAAVVGAAKREILLNNGVPYSLTDRGPVNTVRERIAVAVGTVGYKRIDRTYAVYSALKEELGVEQLCIVGRTDQVPAAVRRKGDVTIESSIPDDAYFNLLARSKAFISTSEVENSSCAVIEGLLLSGTCILSDIPSHREMLLPGRVVHREVGGQPMLLAHPGCLNRANAYPWDEVIASMLKAMGLA